MISNIDENFPKTSKAPTTVITIGEIKLAILDLLLTTTLIIL